MPGLLAGDTKHGVKGHKEARADGPPFYKGGIGVLPAIRPIFIDSYIAAAAALSNSYAKRDT